MWVILIIMHLPSAYFLTRRNLQQVWVGPVPNCPYVNFPWLQNQLSMTTGSVGLRREGNRILTPLKLDDNSIDRNKKRREPTRMNKDRTRCTSISAGSCLNWPMFPLLFSACVFCSPVQKYIYLWWWLLYLKNMVHPPPVLQQSLNVPPAGMIIVIFMFGV